MSRTLKIATIIVALAAIRVPAIAQAQSYSPNYGYSGRDPASRPYNYRGYCRSGLRPAGAGKPRRELLVSGGVSLAQRTLVGTARKCGLHLRFARFVTSESPEAAILSARPHGLLQREWCVAGALVSRPAPGSASRA